MCGSERSRAESAFGIDTGRGAVSALWDRPAEMEAVLALAHGAGAGMRHAFMDALAACLSAERVGVLRFQFPFMEAGRRRPDRLPVAVQTVHAGVRAALERAAGLPVFAGGKSFGGRMTSTAAADGLLAGVRGLVLLGFPLHPRGRPSVERAAHLRRVPQPMLFVQGTRDPLADRALVDAVVRDLGERAHLHLVEGGDHSLAVPKRMGREQHAILADVARTVRDWMARAK